MKRPLLTTAPFARTTHAAAPSARVQDRIDQWRMNFAQRLDGVVRRCSHFEEPDTDVKFVVPMFIDNKLCDTVNIGTNLYEILGEVQP